MTKANAKATATVNSEFDLDDQVQEADATLNTLATEDGAKDEQIAADKAAAKVKASKARTAKIAAKKVVALDPERDRKNWPTIHLEAEEGKPNYEYLAAHGTMKNGDPFGHELQVMRGVDVQVPPSIVYVLQDAVGAHYAQSRDPVTGRMRMNKQDRSAVPWRLIKGGKYIK